MEERKKDHIKLALESEKQHNNNCNLNYEPLLSAHPTDNKNLQEFSFLGKTMKFPMWISSMTGGTKWAETINRNLAIACGEFGLGMGLGSCRILLEDNSRFKDFDVRKYMSAACPLYINFGIAQVEQLLENHALDKILKLNDKLKSDGLIIHINPLQEWVQEEGDTIRRPPIDTVTEVVEKLDIPIIVKEVGQGFGPLSMKKLLQLPLQAIDFGAAGGTNFSRLEMLRKRDNLAKEDEAIAQIGHDAWEMTQFANQLYENPDIKVKEIIVSGGIKNYLQAYELLAMLKFKGVYGMASSLLKHAQGDYEELQKYIKSQILGYRVVEAYMHKKEIK